MAPISGALSRSRVSRWEKWISGEEEEPLGKRSEWRGKL